MKFNVTPEWQALPYQSGTVNNSSIYPVEISVDKTPGIMIYPKCEFSYDDKTVYCRCDHNVEIRTVSFIEAVDEEVTGEDIATEGEIDSLFDN